MKDPRQCVPLAALDRRSFLKLGVGFGVAGMWLGWANPALATTRLRYEGARRAIPRSSARACLFVFLRGGPSHVDLWDLKEGRWSPSDLEIGRNAAGYNWPIGLMPGLADRANMFSIVRSFSHEEAAHERAEYYVETGRRLNPGLRAELPHIGSLIAYDFEESGRRSASDTFPGFVVVTGRPWTNNGFLNTRYAPFERDQASLLQPWGGFDSFNGRQEVLDLVNAAAAGPADQVRQPLPILQEQAIALMRDPLTVPTFAPNPSPAERARYGISDNGPQNLGRDLLVARNILQENRGTRYIEVNHYGWDHHVDIYDRNPNHYQSMFNLSRELDTALSALLDDLASAPGQTPGASLLDETLVVVSGEFGRTVEDLNDQAGRDHWQYAFPVLFAGAGVRGGRTLGATNASGAEVRDNGWAQDRAIHLPDLVTTIHSTLGIDWTQGIYDTPSGRVYWYADPHAIGDPESYEIEPLFE